MWIASVALAGARGEAPACVPLEEAELRTYVLDAQSAIDRGDVDLTRQIVGEVERRLPCLAFVIEPRTWADLLVAKAIVEFSVGGDWQSPMASALRIRPAIDRGVGPSHPLYTWEPPPPPPTGPPKPDGVQLYVDGAPSPVLPPDSGVHLVQKADEDRKYVNTVLLANQPLSLDWVEAPIDHPPELSAWGRIGGAVGAASGLQDAVWPSDVYPDQERSGLALGLTGDLQATFFSPFGVLAHGYAGWFDAPIVDGRISAIWAWRGLTLGGGVGRMTASVAQNVYDSDGVQAAEQERRVYVLQYGELTFLLRSRGEVGWDLGATVGAGPSASLFEVDFGIATPQIGRSRYRVGVALDLRAGAFQELGLSDRSLDVATGATHLTLEWVRGKY